MCLCVGMWLWVQVLTETKKHRILMELVIGGGKLSDVGAGNLSSLQEQCALSTEPSLQHLFSPSSFLCDRASCHQGGLELLIFLCPTSKFLITRASHRCKCYSSEGKGFPFDSVTALKGKASPVEMLELWGKRFPQWRHCSIWEGKFPLWKCCSSEGEGSERKDFLAVRSWGIPQSHAAQQASHRNLLGNEPKKVAASALTGD